MFGSISQGLTDFDMAVFGETHPNTFKFLESQFTMPAFMSNLSDAGMRFLERGKAAFEAYNGAEAVRATKAALRKVAHIWQDDSIRFIGSLASLQQAPLKMQRWIMAEPTIRHEFHMQRCHGYGDTYHDSEPGQVGEAHYDWRLVNDGLVKEDEEGYWFSKSYVEELRENDVELSISEKQAITLTWDNLRDRFERGLEDPTSPYCTTL